MRGSIRLLCVILGMAAFVMAGNSVPSGKLTGVVRDAEGAVISNAIVLVHWDNDGSQGGRSDAPDDIHLTTDKTGEFSANLTAGFYDVAVFAHAFSPNARKVRIRIGQVTNEDVRLPLDPQVSAEIGGVLIENPESPSPKRRR